MTEDPADPPQAGSRGSPVGDPVVRGDESITGDHAPDAVGFDPDDPASVDRATEIVSTFAADSGTGDNLFVLRGAAACATLVRATGSYTAAADQAGDAVTVAFVRKWARVHDLPRPIRKQVATGEVAPTAAAHIARVSGTDRYDLAWAVLEHELSVREIRSIVSEVDEGTSAEEALEAHGVDPGTVQLDLDSDLYGRLRSQAVAIERPIDTIVERALEAYLDG